MRDDYYMSTSNSIFRLVTEWKKYGKLVIAYDFDNTVYDYHKEGHTYHYVTDLLRRCKQQGAYLVVYTANQDIDFIKQYLQENDIPYDYINENPPGLSLPVGGKLYYNILLDDRAGLGGAVHQLEESLRIIKKMRNLG